MKRPRVFLPPMIWAWVAALIPIAVPACSGGERLDGPITRLDVLGTLQDQTGAPVPDAVVQIAWRPFVCGGELGPVPPDTTAADGAFYAPLVEWGTFSWACVRVDVTPPAESGLGTLTLEVDSIRLRLQDRLDTLRLDLTLGPAASLRTELTR